ncbi:hypothetical protein KW791_03545, partial [Candidatus Parcubacteria bacterium]|nr:hypothetical protein [Candidatus Parcubacteria bacterium]
MIRWHKLLLFVGIIFCLLLVDHVQASEQNFNYGPYKCVRQGGVKDCENSFNDYNASVDYQLYKADITLTRYEGFGSAGAVREDVCLSDSTQMWTGQCAMVMDSKPGETVITNWGTFTKTLNDLSSTADYNYANLHVRVDDADTDTNVRIYFRRVEVTLDSSNSTVNVGDTFTVSWTTDWAVQGAEILYGGSAGNGSEPVLANSSKNFKAQSPGTASLTLKATGPGNNGSTTVEKSIQVTVNAQQNPPPGAFNLNNTSCQGQGSFNLSWAASSNASFYNVWRKAWSGGQWVKIASGINATSYQTQEAQGVDWYFYIEAVNSNGSTNSNPGPPGGLYGGNCPLPANLTLLITADGQQGSVTKQSGQSALIHWESQNASSCSIAPSGWTGTTGNQSTGALVVTTTYTLTCTSSSNPAVQGTDQVT